MLQAKVWPTRVLKRSMPRSNRCMMWAFDHGPRKWGTKKGAGRNPHPVSYV
jgi:hypothetical protein